MWRNIAANGLTFLVVLVFGPGVVIWAQQAISDAGPLAQPICLNVPSGQTCAESPSELVRTRRGSRGALFRIGAGYTADGGLKAGSFLGPRRSSMTRHRAEITQGGPDLRHGNRLSVSCETRERAGSRPGDREFLEVADFDQCRGRAPDIRKRKGTVTRGTASSWPKV